MIRSAGRLHHCWSSYYYLQEPLGGAHTDPVWTSQQIKLAITQAMKVSDIKITHRRNIRIKEIFVIINFHVIMLLDMFLGSHFSYLIFLFQENGVLSCNVFQEKFFPPLIYWKLVTANQKFLLHSRERELLFLFL